MQEKGLQRHRFLDEIFFSAHTCTNPSYLIFTRLKVDPTPRFDLYLDTETPFEYKIKKA